VESAQRGAILVMPRRYLIGSLAPLLVVAAIALGNVFVTYLYVSNPSSVFSFVNTWGNFPTGIFTAIFTPDATVFLGAQPVVEWYLVTMGSLLAYLALFEVVNLNAGARELAFRSVFYGLMIILVPMGSNFVSLVRGMSTSGPSTSIFAGLGVVVGFSLVNSVKWIGVGHPMVKEPRSVLAISLSLAVALVLAASSILSPVLFFNITNKVDWGSHIFCFVVGVSVTLLWSLIRRGPRAQFQSL
jgi:hypothetical protein